VLETTVTAPCWQVKPGDSLADIYTTARVMACAEGWIMACRPGGRPFLIRAADVGRAWILE
jgi:hypothetical protein